MPPKRDRELVWVPDAFLECDECRGDVQADHDVVDIVGAEKVRARLPVERCGTCGRRCCFLGNLDALLDELDWEPSDIEHLIRKGRRLDTYIWLGPSHGLVPWEEYRALLEAAQAHAEANPEPPPSHELVGSLPLRGEVWQLASRAADWIQDSEGEPTLSFIALVVNDHGLIRQSNLKAATPHEVNELAELLCRATTQAHLEDGAFRPEAVVVEDPRIANALAKSLSPANIVVRAGQ